MDYDIFSVCGNISAVSGVRCSCTNLFNFTEMSQKLSAEIISFLVCLFFDGAHKRNSQTREVVRASACADELLAFDRLIKRVNI